MPDEVWALAMLHGSEIDYILPCQSLYGAESALIEWVRRDLEELVEDQDGIADDDDPICATLMALEESLDHNDQWKLAVEHMEGKGEDDFRIMRLAILSDQEAASFFREVGN